MPVLGATRVEGRGRHATTRRQPLGTRVEPYLLTEVRTPGGRKVYEHEPERKKVANADVMYIMHTLLRGVVQRGMASRPDSMDLLKTINVPTLLITGDEDILTGRNEAEFMRQQIPGSELRVIPKAGHYSGWEQPAGTEKLLRRFLDGL